jgi:hypothetical protein
MVVDVVNHVVPINFDHPLFGFRIKRSLENEYYGPDGDSFVFLFSFGIFFWTKACGLGWSI